MFVCRLCFFNNSNNNMTFIVPKSLEPKLRGILVQKANQSVSVSINNSSGQQID